MSRKPPTTAVTINGVALREIRIRTGVSVAQLATEVGVGRPHITKIELGSRKVSPQLYDKLCNALKIQDRRALLADPVSTSAAA